MLQIGVRVLLAFSLLLFPTLSFGQDCNLQVKGLVEDVDGESLVGATVTIESPFKGVTTNVDGTFTIDGLCIGNHILTIQYVGFEDQHLAIRVPLNRTLVVKMKPSIRILHDIVVEGQHSQKHSLSQSVGILSDEQISSVKGKPLGQMIQQIPGIQNIMTGGAIFKPVIHGLYGQRLLILNNGLRQEGQQWGLEHAPEIDTYIASEVEVVKGSEVVRYGSDALGGAIIINAQPLDYLSSVGGEINTSLNSNNRSAAFSAMLEGGLTRHAGWRVQGTIKKGGDFRAPEYNLSNTGMDEIDMSTTFGMEKNGKALELYASTFNTEIGILRSAHVGNLGDLQESIISKQPRYIEDFTYKISNPRQKVSHHLGKLSGSIDLNSAVTIRSIYGFQYDQRREYDVVRGDHNIPLFSVELYAHSLDVSVEHEKGPLSGSIGVSGVSKDNFNERGTALLPDYQQVNGGIFAIEKYRKKKWLLEAGARYDMQKYRAWIYDQSTLLLPEFNLNYFAVSAGASFHANNHARFTSNLSISHRPPHISELFSRGLHHSAASIENGLMIRDGSINTNTGDIRKERSYQWVNSFQYNDDRISLELSVYANYFEDYVYLTPSGTQLTIRGFFPVFEYRQTNALLTGSDAYASFDLTKHFTFVSKFAMVRAQDRSDGNKLPFIPPLQLENSLTFKKAAGGKWQNVFVTVSSQTVFEQKASPRTVYPEDVTEDDLEQTFDFMPAPATYVLLKAETGAKLALDNRDLTISFSVENILNSSYRNYMNRLRYYADEAGRNFSIRVNYSFHTH
jgi:iron complex outermembrane recepter protein